MGGRGFIAVYRVYRVAGFAIIGFIVGFRVQIFGFRIWTEQLEGFTKLGVRG